MENGSSLVVSLGKALQYASNFERFMDRFNAAWIEDCKITSVSPGRGNLANKWANYKNFTVRFILECSHVCRLTQDAFLYFCKLFKSNKTFILVLLVVESWYVKLSLFESYVFANALLISSRQGAVGKLARMGGY